MSLAESAPRTLRSTHAESNIARSPQLTLECVSGPVWDRSIGDFDDVCTEQTFAFAALRWSEFAHEPLIFRRGGNVVGGALMLVRRLPLGIGSIAVGKWTPMIGRRADGDRLAIYKSMIETLIGEYAKRRGMMLTLLPRVSPTGDRSEVAFLRERGFVEASNVPFPNRYIVDLRPAEDAHRKALGSKWRYHLQHAEKANLQFDVATPDAFPAFLEIYQAMSSRKKFPDYSAIASVPALLKLPDEALRPQIFFVRRDDQIVAGAVVFKAGNTAVYLYGATRDDALPLRAGYFMQWNILRWLKANCRAQWYDLGGCDGFSGLHQFKKGLVGKAGAIEPMPAVHHYAEKRSTLAIGRGAFALRDVALIARHRFLSRSNDLAKPDLKPPQAR